MQSKKLFKTSAILLFWLAIWQLASLLFDNQILMPSPLMTIKTLYSLLGTSELYYAVFLSIIRIILGFILGVAVGILGAVLSYRFSLFNSIFSPLIKTIKAVPVASFIILAYVWFPTDILPIFICFLMVIPMIWSTVQSGLENIDKKFLELAQIYRLNSFKTFFNIRLPLILPNLTATSLTALGFAWKSGVAAEVICRPAASIGGMLRDAQVYIEMPKVFAVTIVVVILSMILEGIVKYTIRGRKND